MAHPNFLERKTLEVSRFQTVVAFFHNFTIATSSWTWSAAGISCGSGLDCKLWTRCTRGSNCFVYLSRSSPLAPLAQSYRLWRTERTLWNIFIVGFLNLSLRTILCNVYYCIFCSYALINHYQSQTQKHPLSANVMTLLCNRSQLNQCLAWMKYICVMSETNSVMEFLGSGPVCPRPFVLCVPSGRLLAS